MLNRIAYVCAVGLLACVGAAQGALGDGEAPAKARQSTLDEAPQLACVLGLSKDYCNGLVHPGHQVFENCITPIPEGTCRTLRIRAATFDINLLSNNQACGSAVTETCDEIRDGRLKVVSNFTIRLQKHCPYRGYWTSSQAEFTSVDGSIYRGTLIGTLGVGTHRPSSATTICAMPPGTRNCERCYDVSFDGTTWRVGYEATFLGSRVDVVTGEEMCFSLSGDFFLPGTAASPTWASTWRVAGTADGAQLTFCP